jgi:hypothetical protein
VLWRLERARCLLTLQREREAEAEASAAEFLSIGANFRELLTYARLIRGALGAYDEASWRETLRAAEGSPALFLSLDATEMDARRHSRFARKDAAHSCWRLLLERSHVYGYQPGIVQARRSLDAPGI